MKRSSMMHRSSCRKSTICRRSEFPSVHFFKGIRMYHNKSWYHDKSWYHNKSWYHDKSWYSMINHHFLVPQVTYTALNTTLCRAPRPNWVFSLSLCFCSVIIVTHLWMMIYVLYFLMCTDAIRHIRIHTAHTSTYTILSKNRHFFRPCGIHPLIFWGPEQVPHARALSLGLFLPEPLRAHHRGHHGWSLGKSHTAQWHLGEGHCLWS